MMMMPLLTLYVDESSRLPTVWSRLVKFFAKLGIKIVTWELSKDAHNAFLVLLFAMAIMTTTMMIITILS